MPATTASTVMERKGQTTPTPAIAVARPRRMCQPRPSSSGWLIARTVCAYPWNQANPDAAGQHQHRKALADVTKGQQGQDQRQCTAENYQGAAGVVHFKGEGEQAALCP